MRTAVLDIGGTFIKSALYADNMLYQFKETPTPLSSGGKGIVACAAEIVKTYGSFDAIGISTAGQVDPDRGMILYANENIPGYTGTPVRELLEYIFHVPVVVDNDVNMAAVGEGALGAGKEEQDFLCLTYGTGIGGAIIQNKEVYRGSSFSAAEFGSIVTHGQSSQDQGGYPEGIYEKYASATALVHMAEQINPKLLDGKAIFANLKEPEVKAIVDIWIGEILLGLSSLIHIFNPSCIILGGGVMEQTYLIREIRRRLSDYIMPSFSNVRIKQAELGNRAGLLGAAVTAGRRAAE